MRIGAIFARGSCRALKWMALFGVVFALGAGSAFAQLTIKPPKTVAEGGNAMIPVEAKVSIAAAASAAQVTITTTAAVVATTDLTPAQTAAGVTQGEADDSNGNPVTLTLDIPANTGTAPIKRTVTGTIIWQTRPDLDAEDEAFTLTFDVTPNGVTADDGTTVLAGPAEASAITITDAQTQTFELTVDPNQTPTEAGMVTLTFRAMPAPVDRTYDVALAVDETGYSVMPNAWQFSATAAAGTGPSTPLTVQAPANDKNRSDDPVMLTALKSGTVDDLAEAVEIEFKDIHGLPESDKITAMAFTVDEDETKTKTEAMSVMEGGDPVVVTVTVDRGDKGYPSGEALDVALMADASQALDYRIEMTKVSISDGKGKQTADVKVWALKDDDVGEEMLTLNLMATGATKDNGGGSVMGTPLMIAIADDTEPKVSVMDGAQDAIYSARMEAAGDDEMINPGDDFNIKTEALFMAMEGYTLSFGAESDHDAVKVSATNDYIMVMPQEMDGTAKITITASATPMASSFKTAQTTSNIAQIMFEVTVMQMPITYMLMGPDDMNLTEGGMSAMVTVMASRGVDMDTEVMLMRDGASSAGMDDVMIEPMMATIMAGENMAEFEVMAVEDDMLENEGNMAEMLTLFLVVDDMQMSDMSVTFYIWDMSVPALPIIAQLLLAAFLALGGYRRYLRR